MTCLSNIEFAIPSLAARKAGTFTVWGGIYFEGCTTKGCGMKPKPIADWTNSSEYPKWSASLRRFAWEFLRRNPEYQKDWADYLDVCCSIIPHFSQQVKLSDADYCTLEDHPGFARYDPPLLAGENESSWLKRVGRGTRMSLSDWYARKWGLRNRFPDPFFAYEKSPVGLLDINFNNECGACMVTENWEGFKDGKIYSLHRQAALAFDYSLPIDPQIKAASRYLKNHQKWLIKNDVVAAFLNKIPRKELVVYLRMLDAEAVGVNVAKIAKVIYPHEANLAPDYSTTKKVRKALEVARLWRDKWYRLLPSMKK